jgi:AcrR family transcriptional regulator
MERKEYLRQVILDYANQKGGPTLKDIAEECEVSKQTLWLVLRRMPVKESTLDQIQDRLQQQGIVQPDIEEQAFLNLLRETFAQAIRIIDSDRDIEGKLELLAVIFDSSQSAIETLRKLRINADK